MKKIVTIGTIGLLLLCLVVPQVTEGRNPLLSAASPSDGATGVSVNPTITATFNYPLWAKTVNKFFLDTGKGTAEISGSWSCSGTTCTLYPSQTLSYSTKYNAVIQGIRPNPYRRWPWTVFWSFTTMADSPPSVPTNLVASTVSSSQINLSWSASSDTDGTGVAGYKIYRNGTYIKAVTGTSTSDTGLSASTQYCYKVSAYDTAGKESSQSNQSCAITDVSWTITDGYITHIAIDTNGNVYASGYTYGNLGSVNAGGNDLIVIKFDSSGQKQWLTQTGTADYDGALGIVFANDSVYVLRYKSPDAFARGIILDNYSANTGILNWSMEISSTDYGYGLAVDQNGIYIPRFSTVPHLTKINHDKSLAWSVYPNLSGASGTGGIKSVVTDGTYIYITGISCVYSNTDIFVIKYDTQGNQIWWQQWNDSNSQMGRSIALGANGIYAGGEYDWDSIGTPGLILNYDLNGNLLMYQLPATDVGEIATDGAYGIYFTVDTVNGNPQKISTDGTIIWEGIGNSQGAYGEISVFGSTVFVVNGFETIDRYDASTGNKLQ